MSVKVKAYAKINLMLDIISTRKDGYHDLFMIMQSINLYDTVTISETKSKKITITCNIDDIPLDEKNIAYKAADAFFKANKIKNKGINIDIERDASKEKTGEYNLALSIHFVGGLSDEQKQQLLGIVEKCPIHKLLSHATINITTHHQP